MAIAKDVSYAKAIANCDNSNILSCQGFHPAPFCISAGAEQSLETCVESRSARRFEFILLGLSLPLFYYVFARTYKLFLYLYVYI
jgi:hypothetical protein